MVLAAVLGCLHGCLDAAYAAIKETNDVLETQNRGRVEVLLVCGDFQAVRNPGEDLVSMAVPPKYRAMQDFHKYHSGTAVAPVLTIFVGGNHEASNHLSELPHGGWVAPNIYFLGHAGVVRYKGVRIAGISGIYKPHDYPKGRYESAPYDNDSIRSVYHTRRFDVWRLKQLCASDRLRVDAVQPRRPVDIMLSHDWPRGVWNHGDHARLVRAKPFLRDDMQTNRLGSPPCWELLQTLRPRYWFSAHLHCKFAAIVPHTANVGTSTRFLALDKCLPGRDFLQIVEVDGDGDGDGSASAGDGLEYDLEWLAVVRSCAKFGSTSRGEHVLPEGGTTRTGPLDDDDAAVCTQFVDGSVRIPPMPEDARAREATAQTRALLQRLGLWNASGGSSGATIVAAGDVADPNELSLDNDSTDEELSLDDM